MADKLDWKELLKQNPIFGILDEEDIEKLLQPKRSDEQQFPDKKPILQEGQPGNSLYVIGEGQVKVVARVSDAASVPLAILGKGEVFGEMAFFEKRPRSASVIADCEDGCIVRRIEGDEEFEEFLYAHPRLELKLTSLLSERLRRITEGALNTQFRDLSDKFTLLQAATNAQLETVQGAMKTTHALFDATDSRVKEMSERAEAVVESVKRNQEWLKSSVYYAGVIVAVIGGLFGYVGLDKYQDILAVQEEIEDVNKKVSEYVGKIQKQSDKMNDILASAENTRRTAENISRDAAVILNDLSVEREMLPEFVDLILEDKVLAALYEGDDDKSKKKRRQMARRLQMLLNDGPDGIFELTLERLYTQTLYNEAARPVIRSILRETTPNLRDRRRILVQYLELTSLYMDGLERSDQFAAARADLKEAVDSYKLRSGGAPFRKHFADIVGPSSVATLLSVRGTAGNPNKIADPDLQETESGKATDAPADKPGVRIGELQAAWELIP